jgi:hypothetical protein
MAAGDSCLVDSNVLLRSPTAIIPQTERLARVIEHDFELLPDSREVHDRWRSLLIAHNVQGVQVHDARLAASMYVHRVGQLLTMNTRDLSILLKWSSNATFKLPCYG